MKGTGRIALVFLGCLGLLLILLILAGVKPFEVFKSIIEGSLGIDFDGGFRGWGPLSGTLRRSVPLIITGLAVYIALQAGLFNIGAEGQLRVGGIAAVAAALFLGIGGTGGILVASVAGMLGGLLWALPAGIIKVWRGGHEVITTIMLNNIAGHFTKYLISGPMQAKAGGEATTALLPPDIRIATLGTAGKSLVIYPALFLGIAFCTVGTWWLLKTAGGYELRATGANATAARFAGVKTKKVLLWAMCASGAIAGLAGAMHALGQEHRFNEGFSPGFGFDSLGVALLAGRTPLGVIPAAILFAAIDQGAVRAQVQDGLPKEISAVIQGLIILCVAIVRWRKKVSE